MAGALEIQSVGVSQEARGKHPIQADSALSASMGDTHTRTDDQENAGRTYCWAPIKQKEHRLFLTNF